CRHRSCPQCAFIQTERWLAVQRARLLTCDHYHVIFTLPHDLNPLWLGNTSLLTAFPRQSCHQFQVNPVADSTAKLPPVPPERGY
ncbi:MAG: hypothetical protein FJZ47_19020, partial [Candidatus Tectomicrobia bacterium]|nr:hypothetical protein [Candidatus Tectomicrobia bacterium]